MSLRELIGRQRGQGVYQPTYRLVVSFEPEPEPVGAAMVHDLDAVYGETNTWGGGMPPAAGPTGDPSRTFSGDLGAIMGNASGVLSAGAPGALAKGEATGLPLTKVPSRSLAEAAPLSARAQFGVR